MTDNTNSSASLFNRPEEKPEVKIEVKAAEIVKETPQQTKEEVNYIEPDNTAANKGYYASTDVINLVNIRQVYKSKGKDNDFVLFENLNLDIKDFEHSGQFISILGESGCGKSTLLRYISGLQEPTSGEVLLYGKKKTEKDTIPMVFQQYSSFPWKTVLENIALPLQMQGIGREEREERAMKMIDAIGLGGHEHKWAKYPLLSGGQLQRVAIARSLMASPQILLMDEPFGALDIATRTNMQQSIIDVFNEAEVDPTIIFVTHDIAEAVLLSNRIYIMKSKPGRIHEVLDIDLPDKRHVTMKKLEKVKEYIDYIDNVMNS